MIQSEEEYKLNKAIEAWHVKNTEIKRLETEAEELRRDMLARMHELGLKSQETSLGKLSISTIKKCNIIVTDKEFEATLKKHGMYDRFTETKLSKSLVTKYVEKNEDDLYGMVEIEPVDRAVFTPKGND